MYYAFYYTVLLCDEPGKPSNVKSYTETKDLKIGEKVTYLCDDGKIDYRVRQPVVEIECMPNLTWSGPPANCSGAQSTFKQKLLTSVF